MGLAFVYNGARVVNKLPRTHMKWQTWNSLKSTNIYWY